MASRHSAVAAEIWLDGVQLHAVLRLDRTEDVRRQRAGLGALTCRATLSGLWMLPSGIPVPAESVPDKKASRFESSPGWAEFGEDGWRRSYSPPGVVVGLAAIRSDAGQAINAVSVAPPVFERMAFVRSSAAPITEDVRADAAMRGIGLASIGADSANTEVEPAAAMRGVPGVYRWWLAEVAYEAWVQRLSSHASS